jgi:hypothetical protein
MLVGVSAAFTGASAAKGDARGELGFQWLPVSSLVRPGHHAAGSGADRCAIQVEPDAGDHALYVFF